MLKLQQSDVPIENWEIAFHTHSLKENLQQLQICNYQLVLSLIPWRLKPTFSRILSWNMMDFVKDVFCIYWNDCEIFVFKSRVYYIYWFACVEPSLYFRDKVNLLIVENLFDVSFGLFRYYFFNILNLHSSGIFACSFLFCCWVTGLGIMVILAS